MTPAMIHAAFAAESQRLPEVLAAADDMAADRPTKRQPWMTAQAASVTEDLLLPSAAADTLRVATGWDQATLIAKLTGRGPVTPAGAQLIETVSIHRLAFR